MDIGDVLGGLLGGIIVIAVWWFTQGIGLSMAHRYRVVEEHNKSLHRYTEKFYIKLTTSLRSLAEGFEGMLEMLQNSQPVPQQEYELSFYKLARTTKLLEDWFRETTMLLLKDRTGEAVVESLLRRVDSRFFGPHGFLNSADDAVIRQQISVYEPLPDFQAKLAKDPLKIIYDKFQTNVRRQAGALGEVVMELRCLHKVFLFEVNACYDAWYGKRARLSQLTEREKEITRKVVGELVESGEISPADQDDYLVKLGLQKPSWLSV